MNKKSIKAHIKKQLKQKYPGWDKLNKKKRKKVARGVLEDVMTIEEMEEFIEMKQRSHFIKIEERSRSRLDPEKRVIGELLHDDVLNSLLAGPGYTPCKRLKTPAMLLRAELLKSLDYAEMSYRKFCRLEINDMERKKNRSFIGLSLRQKQIISHSELSMFRSSLTYEQQLNLMVYNLTLFKQAGFFTGKVFHGIDGTDLAAKLKSYPIESIEVTIAGKREKLSIYNHLDVDCGERRVKSDKSKFFVGYKIHTLSVVHAESGKAYPLISLLAPANHHDNNFLSPLLILGKNLGLEIQLVITDQGYDGTDVDFMDIHDVTVVSQSQTKMSTPEHVNTSGDTPRVYMSKDCETPMEYIGREGSNHEFRCNASTNSCPFITNCPLSRIIPVDNGLFGAIPKVVEDVSKLENMRKVIERPFNLLKNRNGVDRITVKSQKSVQTVITISTIAILLIEIAGYRKEKKSDSHQVELPLAA
ncbi:transposase [bacterium]|nr:transposase [bacterium]